MKNSVLLFKVCHTPRAPHIHEWFYVKSSWKFKIVKNLTWHIKPTFSESKFMRTLVKILDKLFTKRNVEGTKCSFAKKKFMSCVDPIFHNDHVDNKYQVHSQLRKQVPAPFFDRRHCRRCVVMMNVENIFRHKTKTFGYRQYH